MKHALILIICILATSAFAEFVPTYLTEADSGKADTVNMKKILLLTMLSIWTVLGMACGEKAEDTSAKDPDPDRDGICSPWVSQNGVMDEYGAICDDIDKCPDQAGSGNANGCP